MIASLLVLAPFLVRVEMEAVGNDVAAQIDTQNCSSNYIFVLQLQSDGRWLWPDRTLLTSSESIRRLLVEYQLNPESSVALYAPPDAPMAQIQPVLDQLASVGWRKVTLATARE